MSTRKAIFWKFSGGKWGVATFEWIARVPMGWSGMVDFTVVNFNYINRLLYATNGLCANLFDKLYYGKFLLSSELFQWLTQA